MKSALLKFDIIVQNILLKLDVIVQGILLAVSIYIPLILFTSMLIGGWQLLSSFLKGVLWNSRIHALYFAAASGYTALLALISKNADRLPFFESSELVQWMWYFMLLPPLIGAIWYFVQSVQDFSEKTQSIRYDQ